MRITDNMLYLTDNGAALCGQHLGMTARMSLTARVEVLDAQGFDKCYVSEDTETIRVGCSQCEALAINGVACHETGCPNMVRDDTGDLDDD